MNVQCIKQFQENPEDSNFLPFKARVFESNEISPFIALATTASKSAFF